MKESNTTQKKQRDKDFAELLKPAKIKDEKIVLKRKIYHNGRQYIVKIPKEIITHIGFKEKDMIEYSLVISQKEDKPKLNIRYIKNARA